MILLYLPLIFLELFSTLKEILSLNNEVIINSLGFLTWIGEKIGIDLPNHEKLRGIDNGARSRMSKWNRLTEFDSV